MKNYESIVIFYPDIEEDIRVNAVERLKGIIESNGSIEEIEEWGDRKFAYEIEYHNHGFYYLFKFQTDADTVKEFSRIAKIQESILRHMVINLDK
ncbi:MAG: 30S ribosomal protein S6 [Tissierellia bacterium]|jgi:small subunit ribosomal protein S6|nr:30S ribosomal protein S6 [Tissierellia bacterium]